MHSRVLLTLFALLFTALAGCADDSDPTADDTDDPGGADGGDDGADGSDGDSGSDDDGSDDEDGSDGASGDDGGDGNDTGENTAPTASLSASIEQGETPVNVTFTLDGSDADGDNVTWTFDADDDGAFEAEGDDADLPATVNHSYAEEGLYNATLTISDGINTTDQTVQINVTAAAGGEPGATNQEISASWPASNNAGCASAPYDTAPTEDINYVEESVEPGTWTRPWTATFAASEFSVYLTFRDADGTDLETVEGGVLAGSWDLSGMVPADAATVAFYGCLGTPGGSVEYSAG